MSLAAGTRIGPYQIVARLGAGAMGEVYQARDARLARDVAIKVLPDALAADRDRLRRFEDESRAAGQLNHPNILTVYDVGAHDGLPYIVSELLEGETLGSRLAQGALPPRRAIEQARQIAEGLAAAHDKGIVHRDLKPENLFITTGGRIKILDFGLAKLTRPGDDATSSSGFDRATATLPGVVLGTTGYMSPEQVRGEAADHRSDLFSFGAILYEMLTGRPAFIRRTVADTMVAILNGDVAGPAATNIPPGLESIVGHCLETDVSARFQSAHDVEFDLESWLATTARSGGRHLPAWGFAGAAIVIAVIAAWPLLGRRLAAPPAIGATGRPAIAVMAFENPSGVGEIAWLARGVPSMLVTGLAQTRGLDVVSTSRLDEIVSAAGFGDLDRLDRGRRVDVARRAGAGALVTGTVFKVGDQIRLDVSVEEIASGHVIVAQSVRGADVFPLVDDLASRIARELHLGNAERRPIADVTSPSMDAYRLFTEADEAFQNQRFSDARALLERAVAIDPGFAAAYSKLAFISGQLKDPASARTYRGLAWEHQDRLPPRERLLLQLQTARNEGDSRKAIVIGEQLTAEYPDEVEGFHMLGHAYRDVVELPKSLDVWRRAIRLAPDAGELHNDSGYSLLQLGRYDEGLSEFEEYRRLRPREANPYDSLAEAQLILGDPAKALESYAAALKIDPSFYQSYFGRAWSLAMLGRYDEALATADAYIEVRRGANTPTSHARVLKAYLLSRIGRYREAAAACERALREAAAVSDIEGQVVAGTLQAIHAIERGRYGDAGHVARRWLQETSQLREAVRGYARTGLHLLAGTAAAQAGDLAAARRELATARSTASPANPVESWSVKALEAQIGLSAGDAAAARSAMAGEPARKMWITLGSEMVVALPGSMPIRDVEARAIALAGDRAAAAAIYRRLLTQGRDQPWIAPLEPRFVFQLAKTLQPIDPVAARIEYERFLALWAHADPDLPELIEAKRQVAR